MMREKLLVPKRLLLLFIAINLVVGLWIVNDFGIGPDEFLNLSRAEIALQFYSFDQDQSPRQVYEAMGVNKYKGTALLMVFVWLEGILQPLLGTPHSSVTHYMLFVTFQVGVYLVYVLSRRLVGEWSALLAALLFGTQPLLFGHAFINPKDTPNLTLFMAVVAAGFWMVDRLKAAAPPQNAILSRLWELSRAQWAALPEKRRAWLKGYNLVWLVVVIGVLFGWHRDLISWIVRAAFQAEPGSLLYRIFSQFTSQASIGAVEDYIAKALGYAWWLVLAVVLLLLLVELLLYLFSMKGVAAFLGRGMFGFVAEFNRKEQAAYWLPVVLSGFVLGFGIATRVSNLVAGLVVALYLFLELREKMVGVLVGYLLTTGVICTLSWPFLWYSGFTGIIETLQVISDYPWEGGTIWFRGIITFDQIPPTYLPELIAIQHSIPLLLLALGGLLVAVVWVFQKRLNWSEVFILICWFFLPILYSAAAQPTHYNNFRQFLFITAPIYIFSAVSFEWLSHKIRQKWLVLALGLLVLAPGVYAVIDQHPYQYIYYNEFVGGAGGAQGRYELDYWDTSYKEMFDYVNLNAKPGANILVWGGAPIAKYYARPDLKLKPLTIWMTYLDLQEYDYLITTTTHKYDLPLLDLDSLETVHAIEVDGALVANVKLTRP